MQIPATDRWSDVDKIYPFVIKGGAKSWKCFQECSVENFKQSHEYLKKILKRKVTIRFGKLKQVIGEIQFEKDSPRATIDYNQFLEWNLNEKTILSDNGYGEIKRSDHWGYIDYKYMKDEVSKEFWDDVEWSTLGISRNGEESTMWIGTPGAYSPTHYDTMGWNLHAQIQGSKIWILTPPTAQSNMIPTRLPYEETTVYSAVDVHGDPKYLSNVDGACIFVTNPGDIMFVPPLWWHAVQCQGISSTSDGALSHSHLSISVNTWISDPRDKLEIVKEAVTASMITHFIVCGRLLSCEVNSPNELASGWEVDWHVANIFIQEFGWRTCTSQQILSYLDEDTTIVDNIKRRAHEIMLYPNLLDPFLKRFSKSERVEYGFPVAKFFSLEVLKPAIRYERSKNNSLPFLKRSFNAYESMLKPENINEIVCKLIENAAYVPEFV